MGLTIMRVIICCISLLSALCSGQEGEALSMDQALALSIKYESEIVDTMSSSYLLMESPSFILKWYRVDDWVANKSSVSACSAAFYYRLVPSVEFRLSILPKGSGLGELQDSKLDEYASFLPLRYPDADVKIMNLGNYKPPVGSPSFCEGTYRRIQYSVTPKKDSQATVVFYDFLTVTEDGFTLVASFRGDADGMARLSSSFEPELAQFIRLR